MKCPNCDSKFSRRVRTVVILPPAPPSLEEVKLCNNCKRWFAHIKIATARFHWYEVFFDEVLEDGELRSWEVSGSKPFTKEIITV